MTLEEIKNEFRGVEGINEAKKIYKQLAKILHPDKIGGDEESFKLLNAFYNELIEHKIYFSNNVKIDIELEKVISLILHLDDVVIELVGQWVWVSGDTKEHKEKLKELGFKWASKKKMWYFGELKRRNHKEQSIEDIKAKYGSETLKSKEKKQITD
ncbi:J domain-containing protein [Aliarcobacter cryaerophilus]|uniref:J domain-containing protein n=1 Tax=Aliarcobacter cryaerophilus TaxID=28198 RepID=UPI0021B44D8D|nr:J domain-containing protein [Aliarcobacter cryaerophilus]MCT7505451.1 J domain-containing protein [Aliarcobacter cryaerophilus]